MSCPNPHETWATVGSGGHEKSLGGTQARREAESHRQEAHVAEVSYGEPVIGKPEDPEKSWTTRR